MYLGWNLNSNIVFRLNSTVARVTPPSPWQLKMVGTLHFHWIVTFTFQLLAFHFSANMFHCSMDFPHHHILNFRPVLLHFGKKNARKSTRRCASKTCKSCKTCKTVETVPTVLTVKTILTILTKLTILTILTIMREESWYISYFNYVRYLACENVETVETEKLTELTE